jgi:hypothetical protein
VTIRYLLWRLNWDDPRYGTGPEDAIAQQGARAEASAFASPSVTTGDILGYWTTGSLDLSKLSKWQVRELTQAEALAFARTVAPDAYLLPNGVIGVPMNRP